MRSSRFSSAVACAAPFSVALACLLASAASPAQKADPQVELIAKRNALEQELESVAVIDRKVMVKMRDGKRMAADVYRPKNASGKVPIIFSRTPYNFNFWDVKLGAPRDMSRELEAVKAGYAYVNMNERGHFFSEGNYDILGAPLSDGVDAVNWMASQPWSNGKVGTTGCSSTAEWQMAVVAQDDPHLAAFNVQGFGAGVGKVGPYWEQGNWYRGGAVQMLFIAWIYGEQNQVRPMFPPNTSQADLIKASKLFDLAPQMPAIDWAKAYEHLPEKDIISAVGGPAGIFADKMPVDTGGAMIEREPNSPEWRKGGLWQSDTMPINVPGFWFMSWYDVSVGPNLAAYNFVRSHAKGEAANEQYAVIAPTLHCSYTRATAHTVVGERDMGDARLDYSSMTYAWFDHFLKGEDNGFLKKQPKVTYYTMGSNKWQHSETWPPKGAQEVKLELASSGKANTLNGDGKLVLPEAASSSLLHFSSASAMASKADTPDTFIYDPMHPTPSYGGNVCCAANTIPGNGGSLDQRKMESRSDILVYTSEPLTEGIEVSGPITVTYYVSSDVKDTDVTAKLIDVLPDGTAYNLDETIQRLRYR
ncbi:CocE/NonD family hydrolase, partial [Pinirhizobacter sp.]|uniref:CocE/NonD family hydrolase n=1 Tax=Pinirhizobacter sp. TaxID=2950432 RepID=UPI002F3F2645